MRLKKIKVIQKNGMTHPQMFDTASEAVKVVGISNICKMEEVNVDVTRKYGPDKNPDEILVISKRSNEDLEISKECGYTVTYNKPSLDKVFEGMVMFEASDENVFITKFTALRSYDRNSHTAWKGPGYRPEKEWEWAIFHQKGEIIPRLVAEEQYGKIPGVQGGIGYLVPQK